MKLFDFSWWLPIVLIGLSVGLIKRNNRLKARTTSTEDMPLLDTKMSLLKEPSVPESAIAQTDVNSTEDSENPEMSLQVAATSEMAIGEIISEVESHSEMTDKKEIDITTTDLLKNTIAQAKMNLVEEETMPINTNSTNSSSIDLSIDRGTVGSLQTTSSPVTAVSRVIPKISAIDTPQTGFTLDTFKQSFTDGLLHLREKSLQTATVQDCYHVLVQMVRNRLLQFQHPEPDGNQTSTRIVAELAIDFSVAPHLENTLVNLGIIDQVRQGLQALGHNLDPILAQERAVELSEHNLGSLLGDYLNSLATAHIPAIGYGISRESHAFDCSKDEPNSLWSTECFEAIAEVRFGGHTEAYIDEQGQYRVRWISQDAVMGIPCDTLVPGYKTQNVSVLRLWHADSLERSCQQSDALDPKRQNEELYLKQRFFLVSCTIQDVIRLHLQTAASIETLHERFALQLNDIDPALAIAELMHWLVDEYGLEWEQAWSITQKMFSCTFHSLMPDAVENQWSIPILKSLLPRHLEIIYEINRRFLEEVRTNYPSDEHRVQRMSLIDETGDRCLRPIHLAFIGSHGVGGSSASYTHFIQRTLLSDFHEFQPGKLINTTNGVSLRRFLLQTNPRLTQLINDWIGDGWITNSHELNQLEALVNNEQFCANWWQIRRENKQDFANYLQRRGIEIHINSLFDGQIVPIQTHQRHLLNLLHIITLYIRIKTNSNTDTIPRFAHRSVPRTCLFIGRSTANDPIAQSIRQLIQAVAETINTDLEMQGRLQVVFLQEDDFQVVRRLYAAIDLSEYLPLAGHATPRTTNWKMTLNGALTLGTFNSVNIELQQEVGTKNCFLFGMNAAEINHLKSYNPLHYYNANLELQQAINLIASGYFSAGDTNTFKALGNWLFTHDSTFVLADYPSYINCQERVSQSYQDQKNWTWMSILTTARMGKFSADRAILEYQDLWRLKPVGSAI